MIDPYLPCLYYHLLLLGCHAESGKLYSFGSNNDGQLGLGVKDDKVCSPTLINSLGEQRYQMLSAGMDHSAALTGRWILCKCVKVVWLFYLL